MGSAFASGDATWVVPRAGLNGILSTFNGAKCLDLKNGDTTNGNILQVWTCDATNPNQIFRVDGLIQNGQARILRAGNKCVDIQNGNFAAGANVSFFFLLALHNSLDFFPCPTDPIMLCRFKSGTVMPLEVTSINVSLPCSSKPTVFENPFPYS